MPPMSNPASPGGTSPKCRADRRPRALPAGLRRRIEAGRGAEKLSIIMALPPGMAMTEVAIENVFDRLLQPTAASKTCVLPPPF